MLYRNTIILLSIAFFMRGGVVIAATDTFRVHTDFPTLNDKQNSDQKMFLDVWYSGDSAFKGSLQIQFYKYQNESDSILVLSKRNSRFSFKKGLNKTKLDLSKNDSTTYYDHKFYEVLRRTHGIAPGSYKVFFKVTNSSKTFQMLYLHDVDSNLSATSPVRSDINKSLIPKSKSFLGLRLKKTVDDVSYTGAGKALMNAKNKVEKAARKRGLTSVHKERNGKSYIDLFYQDWFAGRYEVNSKGSLSKQIGLQDKKAHSSDYNSQTSDDLDKPSISSQYKTLNKEKKNDEMEGEIGLSTNFSNGQEQYSGVDNNYYVLKGRLEIPINNMPVDFEGLYTSQDNHNEIKSSYFRIHYDVDKMKSALMKSTNSYNSKFAEAKSKGVGMESLYSTSINNLEAQKAKLQGELSAETSANALNTTQINDPKLNNQLINEAEKQAKDTTGLKQAVTAKADSGSAVNTQPDTSASKSAVSKASGEQKKAQQKTAEEEARIAAKRKKIEELNKKIEKYKTLLAQYQNTNHFDSTIGYNKTKDIGNQSDMTYKQMAKRSDALLPDGQAKNFLTGITTMDAGMFPKMESQYTMYGQQMKGIDFGYDVGFCETGITVGKTQYVGMDGSLDKYTCYSGRATFKPLKKQKISLIYYGYTIDHNMLAQDNFFKNADISAPSFFEPVHILSTAYDGSFSKYLTVGGEVATSISKTDSLNAPVTTLADKMAYHLNADGKIPNTMIGLQATYDNTGKAFVNSTLPVSLSGTQQYKLSAKDDFFHSFVTAGVDFDRFIQNNFSSNATSTKWGFNVKTNSKKYPNIAISYKPFTTFQSVTDTLNIPQRPIFGSVTTGKASYQIRKKGKSIRLSLLYTKSISTSDTLAYGSKVTEASCTYTDKVLTSSVNIGTMQLTGVNIATVTTSPNNTAFLNFNGSYILNKEFSVTGGQEFGVAGFGFCRYSMTGGFMYRLKKSPLTVRINLRYTTYELNQSEGWQQLYSGSLDLQYKIKAKTTEKNNYR